MTRGRAASFARAIVIRTALASLAWWALSEGDLRSAWLAGLVVAATVGSSLSLVRPPEGGAPRVSLAGLARFAPYFLAASFTGAVDVARRAIAPGLPIRPGFVDHPLSLEPGPGRLLVAFLVSLMPGILSAELGEDHLRVHALDKDQPISGTVATLERRVADLLGMPPPA
jgi:multicomponent Na+:H+ antiporter subunit E